MNKWFYAALDWMNDTFCYFSISQVCNLLRKGMTIICGGMTCFIKNIYQLAFMVKYIDIIKCNTFQHNDLYPALSGIPGYQKDYTNQWKVSILSQIWLTFLLLFSLKVISF